MDVRKHKLSAFWRYAKTNTRNACATRQLNSLTQISNF